VASDHQFTAATCWNSSTVLVLVLVITSHFSHCVQVWPRCTFGESSGPAVLQRKWRNTSYGIADRCIQCERSLMRATRRALAESENVQQTVKLYALTSLFFYEVKSCGVEMHDWPVSRYVSWFTYTPTQLYNKQHLHRRVRSCIIRILFARQINWTICAVRQRHPRVNWLACRTVYAYLIL